MDILFVLKNIGPEFYVYAEKIEDYINNLQKKAELGEHYKHLYSEVKKQKDDVVECCKNSIKSINEKLENNKELFEVVDGKIIYLNDYQVVRLKAIRMKCKEILRMLGEIDE
jgi:predicted transcriptional regulator